MNNINIGAQIFGSIAVAIMVMSYLNTKKSRFLFLQIMCSSFYAIQFYLLGAYAAFGINIITAFKSIIFYYCEKKKGIIPLSILIIIEIITVGFGVYIYTDIYSIIPIAISVVYTYVTWQKKLKITYGTGAIIAILWIGYNIFVGAYASVIGNLFEFFASSTGLYRLFRKSKV